MEETSAPNLEATPSIAALTGNAFNLHSQPGASNIIYLDFDGHTYAGTAWNNGESRTAVPYDTDGNPLSFSSQELSNIVSIWARVAEDYAPFNVDVTTEEPASFGATIGRILITKDVDAYGQAMPSQGAGGVAYVGVWGFSSYATRYSPALVYYNNLGNGRPDYVAEAASHEMGHNMGLSHDGSSTGSYFSGYGSHYSLDKISWAPIMGVSYGKNVSQWSKGEYTDANQTQDDVAIIASKVTTRPDDHSNTLSNATPLITDNSGNLLAGNASNQGIISTQSDIDVFRFSTSGGNLALLARPHRESSYTAGGNADLRLDIYNDSGIRLNSNDPTDDTQAALSMYLQAGTYYISVSGMGSSYSTDYGSLGQFFLSGTLPPASNPPLPETDTTPPNPNPMGWAMAPAAGSRFAISMTALTAVDESSSAVQYRFRCVAGGTGCRDSGWVSSPAYTLSGLTANTSYSFRVSARDAAGNETSESTTASASTQANTAPLAYADSGSVEAGSSLSINVLANDRDPDGDALTLSSVSAAGHGTTSVQGSTVLYTPANGFSGTDTFSYIVRDAFGGSATGQVSVIVPDTTPPTPNPMSWVVAPTAESRFAIKMTALTALDGSSSPVQYRFRCVAGGTGCRDSGWVSSPVYTLSGLTANTSYSFRVSARDAAGNETSESATASASTQANTAPLAYADSGSVEAGSSLSINVLANDRDPNGDALTLASVSIAAHGTTSIQGSAIIYTPANGFSGTDTFSYVVKDAYGGSATGQVSVTVSVAADITPPTPNPMGWTVAPAAEGRFAIKMTALTAVDGSSSPVQYRFRCVAGGTGCRDSGWVSSPAYTLSGLTANTSYSFRVSARDAAGNETTESATASASTLANTTPLAYADSGSVEAGSSLSINVLANDRDPDGDALTLTSVSAAAHGTTTIQGSAVIYTPASGFSGTDTFNYFVSDGYGGSATGQVSVTVTPKPVVQNHPPQPVNDTYSVSRKSRTTFNVLSNDSDPDNDKLTVISVSSSRLGNARINRKGTAIDYRAGQKSGTEVINYTVSDGKGGKASASITITIR